MSGPARSLSNYDGYGSYAQPLHESAAGVENGSGARPVSESSSWNDWDFDVGSLPDIAGKTDICAQEKFLAPQLLDVWNEAERPDETGSDFFSDDYSTDLLVKDDTEKFSEAADDGFSTLLSDQFSVKQNDFSSSAEVPSISTFNPGPPPILAPISAASSSSFFSIPSLSRSSKTKRIDEEIFPKGTKHQKTKPASASKDPKIASSSSSSAEVPPISAFNPEPSPTLAPSASTSSIEESFHNDIEHQKTKQPSTSKSSANTSSSKKRMQKSSKQSKLLEELVSHAAGRYGIQQYENDVKKMGVSLCTFRNRVNKYRRDHRTECDEKLNNNSQTIIVKPEETFPEVVEKGARCGNLAHFMEANRQVIKNFDISEQVFSRYVREYIKTNPSLPREPRYTRKQR